MPMEQKFSDWKGVSALGIKDILGKDITVFGEQSFQKPATNPRTGKPYIATFYVFFAVSRGKPFKATITETDKESNKKASKEITVDTGAKIKFFGTENLFKNFEKVKEKAPFDDVVEFVEGGGQYKHGYYKFRDTKPPFMKQSSA